jgi:hypothetical protein
MLREEENGFVHQPNRPLPKNKKRQAAIGLVSGVNRVRQKWRIVLAIHPLRVMMLASKYLSPHSTAIIAEENRIVKLHRAKLPRSQNA